MSETADWFRKPRNQAALVVAGLTVAGTLAPVFGFAQEPTPKPAGTTETIGAFVILLLARVVYVLVAGLGLLLIQVIKILVNVAQYNNFVNAAAVVNGWSIVRDVTNMFFILILLLIAFGTMLGIDKYSYKNKTLSNLLIMAIVVNFTRTICGILIDFSQVVMLTFVYGFQDAAGGNFANALRLNKLFQTDETQSMLGSTWDTASKGLENAFNLLVAMIGALILVFISLIVICYMTVLLVMRAIVLWLLIVMSPLAFFLRAVPTSAASKYYGTWWQKFTGQLVFGPLMAFFLWLSLVSVTSDKHMDGFKTDSTGETFISGSVSLSVMSMNEIEAFIIAICLLFAGSMMAAQMANESAGMAQAAMSGGAKVAKGVGSAAANAPIPFTGGKGQPNLSLASLGKAAGGRFMNTAPGRALGYFGKDKRDDRRKQREMQANEIFGNKDEAARQRKELVSKGADAMSKKYSNDQLKQVMDSDKASQMDRQRAMLAYAQRGGEALKGKGEGITGLVGKVGGNKDFELQVRQALKASGDPDAMIRNKDQAKRELEAASPKEKARMLQNIDKDVERGLDGQPKRAHANDYLQALDKRSFDQFSDGQQKKVMDALHLAAAQEKDTTTRDALKAQVGKLSGDPNVQFDQLKADNLLAKMEGRNVKERAGRAEVGKYDASARDSDAARVLSDTTGGKERLEAIKNLQSRVASGEDLATLKPEMNALMSDLTTAAQYAAQKEPVTRDENGVLMENDELIKGSQVFKDVEAAVKTDNSEEAANRLKAAAIAIEDATREQATFTRSLTPERRQEVKDTLDRTKSGMDVASSSFDRALTAGGSDKEKLRDAQKGASQAIASIDNVIGGRIRGKAQTPLAGQTISEELRRDLKGIRDQMYALKGLKKLSAEDVGKLRELKEQMTRIQKQI